MDCAWHLKIRHEFDENEVSRAAVLRNAPDGHEDSGRFRKAMWIVGGGRQMTTKSREDQSWSYCSQISNI